MWNVWDVSLWTIRTTGHHFNSAGIKIKQPSVIVWLCNWMFIDRLLQWVSCVDTRSQRQAVEVFFHHRNIMQLKQASALFSLWAKVWQHSEDLHYVTDQLNSGWGRAASPGGRLAVSRWYTFPLFEYRKKTQSGEQRIHHRLFKKVNLMCLF